MGRSGGPPPHPTPPPPPYPTHGFKATRTMCIPAFPDTSRAPCVLASLRIAAPSRVTATATTTATATATVPSGVAAGSNKASQYLSGVGQGQSNAVANATRPAPPPDEDGARSLGGSGNGNSGGSGDRTGASGGTGSGGSNRPFGLPSERAGAQPSSRPSKTGRSGKTVKGAPREGRGSVGAGTARESASRVLGLTPEAAPPGAKPNVTLNVLDRKELDNLPAALDAAQGMGMPAGEREGMDRTRLQDSFRWG